MHMSNILEFPDFLLLWVVIVHFIAGTVEPPLSGPPLSGHTLLNGHMSKSQKYLVYIIKDKTSIERPSLFSGRGHLQVVPSSVFLIIVTSFKRSASFSKHNFPHN